MNIQELIEHLSEIAIDNPKAEVRVATQPSWPLYSNPLQWSFEHSINGLVVWNKKAAINREVECIRQDLENAGEQPMSQEELISTASYNLEHRYSLEHSDSGVDVVYLEEGSQIGYLPDGPKEKLGW